MNEKDKNKERKNKDNEYTYFDEDQLQMGDKYDVVKTMITVSSPITTMNPDFIMSDLDPEIMNNQLIQYIKRNLYITEMMNTYLSRKGDEEWRTRINQIMLNSVYSIINLSRANKGKVIRAILRYIEGQREDGMITTPQETEEKTEGIGKLNPMNIIRKNKNEEKR